MSAGFARDSMRMRAHCVSRPLLGMSDRFLNDYRHFHTNCVSHRRPVESPRRRLPGHPQRHSSPHPLGSLLLRVGLTPSRARPPVALSLTRLLAAHALAISSPHMWTEPSTANSARTGAKHAPSSRLPGPPTSRSRDQARTRFGEQTRVNSRERRSSLACLYEAFPPAEAHRIARRFEVHHTPRHGSWLNVAEIFLSTMSTQCLDQRIGSAPQLRAIVAKWQSSRTGGKVSWRLTTEAARIKLRRLCPSMR